MFLPLRATWSPRVTGAGPSRKESGQCSRKSPRLRDDDASDVSRCFNSEHRHWSCGVRSEKVQELGQDLEVRIRSDRTVPYARVEPVMLSCAKAGIWNVTFAVYRPEDAR